MKLKLFIINLLLFFRQIRDYGITSERPSAAAQGSGAYCAANKCFTSTEFVLLGLGAVIGGVMVGVIGISWFKYSVGLQPLLVSLISPDCIFLLHEYCILT